MSKEVNYGNHIANKFTTFSVEILKREDDGVCRWLWNADTLDDVIERIFSKK